MSNYKAVCRLSSVCGRGAGLVIDAFLILGLMIEI